ncbi:hypothetical protein TTHERM_000782168 (macronuclear) [Tetrahymena thermophila SB210]|uniref:Uncharacterized protein n=1 Tax=Tetrahymena thermophila (strain SB210) TaxID=312017 RepID=W7XJH5_TETTS|nr:hypothetical protein TTHERM_000782168 [Tetrahymena thermophila SB210]EWS75526.1 hypothetical protein TTHERM_000782168 [Tetrahymena thermophila SB210]|eukprot:XP_012651995.1 hypothetical protein TTHERM_000782168 [Tetrahymena thermophila SB210]
MSYFIFIYLAFQFNTIQKITNTLKFEYQIKLNEQLIQIKKKNRYYQFHLKKKQKQNRKGIIYLLRWFKIFISIPNLSGQYNEQPKQKSIIISQKLYLIQTNTNFNVKIYCSGMIQQQNLIIWAKLIRR